MLRFDVVLVADVVEVGGAWFGVVDSFLGVLPPSRITC